MEFSEADKQFILNRLSYGASRFVKEEYGEEAMDEFFDLYSAGFTKEEWNKMLNLNNTIMDVFYRRVYELDRMWYKPEGLEKIYEKHGPPPIVDFTHIPPKTLQLGLLLAWQESSIRKEDSETDEKFERRKDMHDFLFGHVNQEALANPLIDFESVDEERAKQREKLQNYIGIIGSKWEAKNGATPGTG